MMVGDRGEPINGPAGLQESHSVEYPNDSQTTSYVCLNLDFNANF